MTEATTVYDTIVAPPVAKDKKVSLVVAWYFNDYKVISITNTTYLKPGMWLTPRAVEKCCQLEGWEVKIMDNTILNSIVGAASDVVKHGVGL